MYSLTFIFIAASKGPGLLQVSAGVTNISIEWGEVDCEERNGVITGYSVRYGLSSGMSRKTFNISGTDVENRIFRMDGLLIRTSYSFEVAAINEDGVGMYSSAMNGTTAVPTGLVVLMVDFMSNYHFVHIL